MLHFTFVLAFFCIPYLIAIWLWYCNIFNLNFNHWFISWCFYLYLQSELWVCLPFPNLSVMQRKNKCQCPKSKSLLACCARNLDLVNLGKMNGDNHLCQGQWTKSGHTGYGSSMFPEQLHWGPGFFCNIWWSIFNCRSRKLSVENFILQDKEYNLIVNSRAHVLGWNFCKKFPRLTWLDLMVKDDFPHKEFYIMDRKSECHSTGVMLKNEACYVDWTY